MRVLLSVGCNRYEFTSPLSGAERDAKAISDSLTGRADHRYSPETSRLLLSPRANEFRSVLSDMLYDNEVTVFTFYFAGHAVVFEDTLYLAFVDCNPDRIASTAIAFPETLRVTASARPKQVNFVLDACNSSGLGFDLAAILRELLMELMSSTFAKF